MENNLFTQSNSVSSNRIIYTPSTFARSSLIHLQETGTLKALYPHKSERSGLTSCLFFTVLNGDGLLTYDGASYELRTGDCVFIDCRKAYSHSTPLPSTLPSTSLPSTSLSAEELNDDGMVGRNGSVVDNKKSGGVKNNTSGAVDNSVGSVKNGTGSAVDNSVGSAGSLWSLHVYYGKNVPLFRRNGYRKSGAM